MGREDYLEEIHVRILRVTEDLRAIQRQLNCAAMEAPSDPELMEALSQLPEMDALQMLKSSLDQMRHFLWFYMQVMTNESEIRRETDGRAYAKKFRPMQCSVRRRPSWKNSRMHRTRRCCAIFPTANTGSRTRQSSDSNLGRQTILRLASTRHSFTNTIVDTGRLPPSESKHNS